MDNEEELTKLRGHVQHLEHRVARVEAAFVRIAFGAATSVLIVGLVLPYIRYTVEGESRSTAIAWMALQMLGESNGSLDGEATVFLLALLLPVLVSITALILLWTHAIDRDAKKRRGLDAVIGSLLGLSIFGVWFVATMASNVRGVDNAVGPALWLYIPGALAVSVLLVSARARAWWSAS